MSLAPFSFFANEQKMNKIILSRYECAMVFAHFISGFEPDRRGQWRGPGHVAQRVFSRMTVGGGVHA